MMVMKVMAMMMMALNEGFDADHRLRPQTLMDVDGYDGKDDDGEEYG